MPDYRCSELLAILSQIGQLIAETNAALVECGDGPKYGNKQVG